MPKVHIIGISDAGLDLLPESSRALLRSATLLVGGERHLEFVPDGAGEKLVFKANLLR
jgi:precorrin-6B methylase 1